MKILINRVVLLGICFTCLFLFLLPKNSQALQFTVTNSCEGMSTGAIDMTVYYGPNQPYTYIWAGPNDFLSFEQDIEQVPAGTYYVTMTDVDGCMAIDQVEIEEIPCDFSSNDFLLTYGINCNSSVNNSLFDLIVFLPDELTPPFTFEFPQFIITSNYTVEFPGVAQDGENFNITVTDANNLQVNIVGESVNCSKANEPEDCPEGEQLQANITYDNCLGDKMFVTIEIDGDPPFRIRDENGHFYTHAHSASTYILGPLPVGVPKTIEIIGDNDCNDFITLNTNCGNCQDGIQNQGETGIDCGGPCANNCPSCDDGILNQGETNVDCGGPCIPCPSPTCFDGIQNQGEAGVDCGGPCTDCTAPGGPNGPIYCRLNTDLKPNPFNKILNIEVEVDNRSIKEIMGGDKRGRDFAKVKHIHVSIYDAKGQIVRQKVKPVHQKDGISNHSIRFNTNNLRVGIYQVIVKPGTWGTIPHGSCDLMMSAVKVE